MPSKGKPLRIFVAMPGNLGEKSRYSSSASVKLNLLDPIKKAVSSRLKRPVEMNIEKEKKKAGDIYSSMFNEALEADVYIADLTNANPNVYLELGVRWALRDGLTILICQDTGELRFNVSGARAFQYTPDNIRQQVGTLTEMIVAYQSDPAIDSPVRQSMKLVTIAQAEFDALNEKIETLEASRGQDLYKAALARADPRARAELLQQAIEINPAYSDALFELGITQRETSEYPASEKSLKQALSLEPRRADIHRELGVTYVKMGKLDEAVESLQTAIQYDSRDSEAWSNLGGARRREGVRNGPPNYDKAKLVAARDAYQEASRLDPDDLYSALNVCRLDLVLARWEPSRLETAIAEFRHRRPLSEWQAFKAPDDYWRKFDLAEATLFATGDAAAVDLYRAALAAVPPTKRSDVLRSVRGPLGEYVEAGVLPAGLNTLVVEVLGVLADPA